MLDLKVDMQIFGGNASTSMQSSVYCVGRSALASMVLVGFAYGGLIEGTHSAHAQQVDPYYGPVAGELPMVYFDFSARP